MISADIYRALARLFLHSNTAQMPPAFERGLIEFFSTFEVKGIRITAGTPPAKPDLDWARIHLLMAEPEYFGKLRVLLYNLRKGVDEIPPTATPSANPQPKSRPLRSATSPPAISRPRNSPAPPWPPPISPNDRSPKSTSASPAPTCSPDHNPLRNIASSSTNAKRCRSGGRTRLHRPARWQRRTRRTAILPPLCEAGSTSARAYIEYAKLETDTDKAAARTAQSRRHQPEARTSLWPCCSRDTDPRMRIDALESRGRAQSRATLPTGKRSPKPTSPNTITAKQRKPGSRAEQAATRSRASAEMRAARMAVEQAAPGLRSRREAPRSRGRGARDRRAQERSPRRSAQAARSQDNEGPAKPDAPGRAVVGRTQARGHSQRHAQAGRLPRQTGASD